MVRRYSFILFFLLSFGIFSPQTVHAGFSIQEFPIPDGPIEPLGITLGPDGRLWFLANFTDQVGVYNTETEDFEFFGEGISPNAGLEQITLGPDGNLWFTEYEGNRIGRITPDGMVTEFTIPTMDSNPEDIVTGPDGNLWFTELNQNKIGRITPEGEITEFDLPNPDSFPTDITVGPDGALWFTENGIDKIGRITTGGAITEFDVPPGTDLFGIATGPDGNLWYCGEDANKIGRMTTAGVVTEFTIPTAASQPVQIVSSPDGNLYFTENAANKIGSVTTDGEITEYIIPTAASGVFDITVGPKGNIWFTEGAADQLGKVPLPGVLQFTMSEFTVNENGGQAIINVERVGGSATAISVDYATANDTAIAGMDYEATSGTLNWDDEDVEDKSFRVEILNNSDASANRSLFLNLSNPSIRTEVGAIGQAVLTIIEDQGGGGCHLQVHHPVGTRAGMIWLMIPMGLWIGARFRKIVSRR